MRAGEIWVDAVLKSGKFEAGMSQLERKTRKDAAKMQGSIDGINWKKAALLTATFATAAGYALTKLITKVSDTGDMFDKMSLRTGITVQELSKFDYIAKSTGTDIAVFEKSMIFLSKAMLDVSRGIGVSKETFKEMRISVKDSSGALRGQIDILKEAADKISKMTDETKQVAYATQLFGSSGTALLPILKLGSAGIEEFSEKAEKLGLVWSAEEAKKAADFGDAITDLGGVMAGIGKQIALEFIPPLTEVSSLMTEILKKREDLGFRLPGVPPGEVMTPEDILKAQGSMRGLGLATGAILPPPPMPSIPSIPIDYEKELVNLYEYESVWGDIGAQIEERLKNEQKEFDFIYDISNIMKGPVVDAAKLANDAINESTYAYNYFGGAITTVLSSALMSHQAFFTSVTAGFTAMLNQMLAALAARAILFTFLNVVTGGSFGAARGGLKFLMGSFQSGGYTGEFGGMVHKGEYVIPEWMTQRMPGTIAGLEKMRQGNTTNQYNMTFSSNVNNESKQFFRTEIIPQMRDALRSGRLKT